MALLDHQKPDIILFMTDQQRFDTIGALGLTFGSNGYINSEVTTQPPQEK